MKQYPLNLISCFALNITLISRDIYGPSLPVMAADLHISSSLIGTSITLFLIGTAISQLLFGILSDIKGRKPIMLLGLGICLLGNAFSFITGSAYLFLFWRFVAGFGAGAAPVITRAIASDLYTEKEFTKAITYLSMSTVISPLLAPALGGVVQDYYGWRANFIILSLLTLICFASFFKVPESNSRVGTVKLNIKTILAYCYVIIKDPLFLIYSTLSVSAFAPGVIYCIITPFIFQDLLKLTAAQNGVLYAFPAVGYFIGAFLANKLINKIHEDQIIFYGVSLSLIGGISMLVSCYFVGPAIYSICLPMMLSVIGGGLITPISNKQSIALSSQFAGMSASLLGFIRLGGGFALGLLVPLFNIHTQLAMAIILILFAVSGFVLLAPLRYNRAGISNSFI